MIVQCTKMVLLLLIHTSETVKTEVFQCFSLLGTLFQFSPLCWTLCVLMIPLVMECRKYIYISPSVLLLAREFSPSTNRYCQIVKTTGRQSACQWWCWCWCWGGGGGMDRLVSGWWSLTEITHSWFLSSFGGSHQLPVNSNVNLELAV